MLFITEFSSFFHLLLMTGLYFKKCYSTIENNKYTFMKTIAKNEERDVYRQFTTPHNRNYILSCGSICGEHESCIGIDVCDGRICRLWNTTIYQNISANNSNELCQRYIKVIYELFNFHYRKNLQVFHFFGTHISNKSRLC